MHGREILATRDHADHLRPQSNEHILDIGSGIGGPARYLAHTFGCRVTGIDVTPQFVDAARQLTDLTGLTNLVQFDVGDAAHMPYGDGTFDAAYGFYVGMNLPDTQVVLTEAHRVLKASARMLWTQAVETGAGPLDYPLPWAREPSANHTSGWSNLEASFRKARFEIIHLADETALHVELAHAARRSNAPAAAPVRMVNEAVLGSDFPERRRNYIANLETGRLASLVVQARRLT